MKATEFLRRQHREVRDLVKQIEAADGQTKVELFEELAANWVAHDAVERRIFYPACKTEMKMTDLPGESHVEHDVVEFSLYLANQAKGSDDFERKCTALKEVLEHHLGEEERELFPKVERALGRARLEELAEGMERFTESVDEDFREALSTNLKHMLTGSMRATATRQSGTRKRASGSRATRKTA